MKLTASHFLLLPVLALVFPSCVGLGPGEIGMIALVVLLLFGGAKLPALMRGMGSGINEFKKGLKEGEPSDDETEDEKEKETPKE